MCAWLQWPQTKCFVCDKFTFYWTRTGTATASKTFSIWMCSVSSQFDSNGCTYIGGIEERRTVPVTRSARSWKFVHTKRLNDIEDCRSSVLPKSIPIFWKVLKCPSCTRHLSALIRCDRVFRCYLFNVACHTPPHRHTLRLSLVFALCIAVHNTIWRIICDFTSKYCRRTLCGDKGVRLSFFCISSVLLTVYISARVVKQ